MKSQVAKWEIWSTSHTKRKRIKNQLFSKTSFKMTRSRSLTTQKHRKERRESNQLSSSAIWGSMIRMLDPVMVVLLPLYLATASLRVLTNLVPTISRLAKMVLHCPTPTWTEHLLASFVQLAQTMMWFRSFLRPDLFWTMAGWTLQCMLLMLEEEQVCKLMVVFLIDLQARIYAHTARLCCSQI